jgi:hypothetical protein
MDGERLGTTTGGGSDEYDRARRKRELLMTQFHIDGSGTSMMCMREREGIPRVWLPGNSHLHLLLHCLASGCDDFGSDCLHASPLHFTIKSLSARQSR